jgi:hypothetical protein
MKRHSFDSLTHVCLRDASHVLLILVVAVFAWWPLLLDRPPVGDDYFFGAYFLHGSSVGQGLIDYWRDYGIWRIFGQPLPFILRETIPFSDRILPILIHSGALILFYLILRRLETPKRIRIATSLVFAAMPFGFEALTWISACSFALSAMFCLGAFLVITRPIADDVQALWNGMLGGVLGFLSIGSTEATLLVIPWIALYPLFRCFVRNEGGVGLGRCFRTGLISALIMVAFEALWVGLHLATKANPGQSGHGVALQKHPHFYAPALISGVFRQYEQGTYFVHLPILVHWLTALSWWSAFGSFLIAIALSVARTPNVRTRFHWLLYLYFGVLVFTVPAVYAIGGGFGVDSRKAYVIWPFLLLSGAFFLGSFPARVQQIAVAVAVLSCPILVLSSHAVTRIWTQSANLINAAAKTISDEDVKGPYRLEWEPNPYTMWPEFERLCGFRFDCKWAVQSVTGRFREEDYKDLFAAPLPAEQVATVLVWNPTRERWEKNKGRY